MTAHTDTTVHTDTYMLVESHVCDVEHTRTADPRRQTVRGLEHKGDDEGDHHQQAVLLAVLEHLQWVTVVGDSGEWQWWVTVVSDSGV